MRGRATGWLCVALLVGPQACRRARQTTSTGSASSPEAPSATTRATTSTNEASLFGGERGLDHVGIAVSDLTAATETYHDRLGFNHPAEGTLPNGIRNVNYYFADSTYLETLVYWDREKAPGIASFTDKHTGALFAVLSAFSTDSLTRFLGERGIPIAATYSGSIQTAADTASPREQWKTAFLPHGLLAGDPFYFIAYRRSDRDAYLQKLEDPATRRILHHKNTALGLRAVWCAVADLTTATRAYESIGLARGREFTDPALDATGQVFAAGAGEVWLVAPQSGAGAVGQFLRDRGPGIVGITLAAGSVVTAAAVIAEHTGSAAPTYDGQLGSSIRIPPELTHGVWLEFSEQR